MRSLAQCKEVFTFIQFIQHLHDFVNLSQAVLSLPFSKQEAQSPSSLLLGQLLYLLDYLLACLCHFPYSTPLS